MLESVGNRRDAASNPGGRVLGLVGICGAEKINVLDDGERVVDQI
jgi:hypothetical protein